jgi:hypothetical protein
VIKGVLICLALFTASPSTANQLVEIGVTADGSIYSADFDSVRRSGTMAQVWIYVDHSRNRRIAARSSRELWKFDCNNQTTVTLYAVDYDRDGRVLNSQSEMDNPYLYTPVVPNTFGSFAMNFACTGPSNDLNL